MRASAAPMDVVPGFRRVPESWRRASQAEDGEDGLLVVGREGSSGTLVGSPPGSMLSVGSAGPGSPQFRAAVAESVRLLARAGAAAGSPTLPPTAAPPRDVGDAPLDGLIAAAVSSVWAANHAQFPVFHRPSFERAMRGEHTSTYGGRRPLALAYALACMGSRALSLPERQRNAVAKHCLDRSVELLLAKGADDLEACQALLSLCETVMLAGAPRSMLPLLARAVRCSEALLARTFPRMPETEDEWLFREQVVRLRVPLASMDLGVAAHSDAWKVVSNYFAAPWTAPAPDDLFDDPEPAEAFLRFRTLRSAGEPAVSFPPDPRDLSSASHAVRALVSLPFSGTGTTLCLLLATQWMRFALWSFRSLPAGNERRALASGAASAFFGAVCAALPPEIGTALAAGDFRPLLLHGVAHLGNPLRASVAAQCCMLAEGLAAESFLAASFPSAALLRAQRILAGARALRGTGPGMRWVHHACLEPVVIAGKVALGAAGGMAHPGPLETAGEGEGRRQGWRELVRLAGEAVGFLEDLGRREGPFARGLAREMRGALEAEVLGCSLGEAGTAHVDPGGAADEGGGHEGKAPADGVILKEGRMVESLARARVAFLPPLQRVVG